MDDSPMATAAPKNNLDLMEIRCAISKATSEKLQNHLCYMSEEY
jgi:hypothetical protein